MPLRAAFGTAGHNLQAYLPGTDPALLPAPAGPDAAPAPDALASPPYSPGGDGADTLFDGRVTAAATGAGTAAAARTVFDVVGPWNSVKNAAAAADEAADLAFLGFVHVDAAVGLASGQGSTLELVGAKRGNLVTGAGADLVDVRAISNDDWTWSREFRIASGSGDDRVLLPPLDVDAAVAAGDPTFASAVGGAGDETEEPYDPPDRIDDRGDEWAAAAVAGEPASAAAAGPSPIHGYDGDFTGASLDLGDGADVLAVQGRIRTSARGGAGDDWLAGEDITPGAQGSGAGTIIGLGDGRALFTAWGWAENGSDAPGWWTWISDGTAAGTAPLVDISLYYRDAGISLDPLG